MSDDLPGFDFSKVDILSAGTPQPVNIAKLLTTAQASADTRRFEITMEGSVKASGYSPDEVEQILRHYREHMVTFSRAMQELQAYQSDADAVRYSPNMTDEEIRDRVRNL